MGSGSGNPGPFKIGGISGQGGGRILSGTGGGVGELIMTSPRLQPTLSPGYPDYRPTPPYGATFQTVFAAPGGGPGQSGKGDLFAVYVGTDGNTTAVAERTGAAGGGGGWGAAGGTGLGPSSVALEVVAGGNPGAAGGKAINTNGHAVTWLAGSARTYGAVG